MENRKITFRIQVVLLKYTSSTSKNSLNLCYNKIEQDVKTKM